MNEMEINILRKVKWILLAILFSLSLGFEYTRHVVMEGRSLSSILPSMVFFGIIIISLVLGTFSKIESLMREILHSKEELKWAQEQWWQQTFDSMDEGVFISDADLTIVRANRALGRLLNASIEELVGRKCYEVVHNTKEPIENCPLLKSKKSMKAEYLEYYEPNLGRWLSVSSWPIMKDDKMTGSVQVIKDITELKKAEESLRESEERFRMVTEKSLAGVYIIQDGKFRYVNPALAEIFGYTPDEIIDKLGPLDLTHPDDRPLVAENIRKRMHGEVESIQYTFQGIKKDGTPIICEALGRHVDYHGRSAIIGTLLDITDRKRLEEALKSSEKRLKTIFESIPTGIVIIDAESHRIMDANPTAVKMIDAPRERIIGSICHQFICPAERGKCPITDLGKTVDHSERVLLKADGQSIPILKTVIPIVLDDRKYLVESFVDIEKQKQLEESLKRSLEELKAISEIDRNIIESPDLSTMLKFIVEKARKLTGSDAAIYSFVEDDVIVHHTSVGIRTKALEKIRLKRGTGLGWLAIQKNKPIVVEDFFTDKRLKDAPYDAVREEGLVSFLAVPVTSRGGDPLGILYVANRRKTKFTKQQQRALTTLAVQTAVAVEHAKLLEETKKAYEELKSLDKMKSNIISNVSHELRTPITIVKGALELVRFEEDPAERNRLLKIALNALRRQDRIVENLVEAARMEKAEIKLSLEDVNLAHIVPLVVGEIKPILAMRDLKIELDVSEDLPPVKADYEQLMRVFRNLLDNAVKFNREGGRIVVSARKRDGEVLVCVSDTGIGIPRGELERVFDRFYQVDSSTSRPYGGMGMGLAVAKEIVEAHGGRIWAESRPGEGSKFYFTLPAKRS
jgi:PAS domain S-box-containing protein